MIHLLRESVTDHARLAGAGPQRPVLITMCGQTGRPYVPGVRPDGIRSTVWNADVTCDGCKKTV